MHLKKIKKGKIMIAIPLDSKDSTTMSKLYGNAKFFALLDLKTGSYSVSENKGSGNGLDTAEFVTNKGAVATLFYYMGEGVYKAFKDFKVDVYSCEHQELSLEDIYKKFMSESFPKVTNENSKELLDPGTTTRSCACGCEDKE